ncbi:hypothetical protein [Neptuniibacter sp. QD37_11]|uniref:hypothetical protein n=1 Tax=Neptuniibacter sp. QD37_11 TaxID=3398209 RepID=UPI0039F5AECB
MKALVMKVSDLVRSGKMNVVDWIGAAASLGYGAYLVHTDGLESILTWVILAVGVLAVFLAYYNPAKRVHNHIEKKILKGANTKAKEAPASSDSVDQTTA